jgi:hypothetical protein
MAHCCCYYDSDAPSMLLGDTRNVGSWWEAAGMATMTRAEVQALDRLLRGQKDVVSRAQALTGMTEAALRHRLRPGGPWRIVLPGIYLATSGLPTIGQREMATLLYGGPGSAITGSAALERRGIRVPHSEVIDVLVPVSRRRQSVGFVRVQRTGRMPGRVWVTDGLRYAPVARSVADAVRGLTDQRAIRAVVADAVQSGRCPLRELAAELASGPKTGSGGLRVALAEVADGVRSVVEGDLRALIRSARLPTPLYNPYLFVAKSFLAQPDVWWPDAGVAGEVDSREWHLSPDDWDRTLSRHARMSAHGIIVLHFTPRRIRTEPAAVVSDLRRALDSGRRRPPLQIRTVPVRLGPN